MIHPEADEGSMRQLTYVGGSSIEWWDVPDCVARVAAGHFHPEQVITRKIRFEDAHEAIGIQPSGSPSFAMALNNSIMLGSPHNSRMEDA